MEQIHSARKYRGPNVRIYFHSLTDDDIEGLILACQKELRIRSQEISQETI